MQPAITFQKTAKTRADTAIIMVFKDKKLGPAAEKLDEKCAGLIRHQLKKSARFKGNKDQTLVIAAPRSVDYAQIVIVGLGDPAKLDLVGIENAGGKLFPVLEAENTQQVHLFADTGSEIKNISAEQLAAHFASGIALRSYKFDKYKSKAAKKDRESPGFKALETITPTAARAAKLYETLGAVVGGVFFARDLVNEPPNELYPDSFAKRIKEELTPLGVEVEIIDEKKMLKLGFHAHLAVGMGSIRSPRAVIMRWNGSGKKNSVRNAPLAFVGKGVTFDTGGINIKPSAGMEDMKMDMGGAAAVCGLMKTLALRQSKAHVVGIVGLAENMPSHMSYRPSDIIKSAAGKTIEVLNTDAEGRLVLADCLTYIQRTYKPRMVIDLATLTGAMMVALGEEYCGTFSNDNHLWLQLEEASRETGEKLWRMPLDEVFKKDMESKIADLRNLGGMGRLAGACTAAGFLEHFIEEGRPWAHMDIAGTAWTKADRPTSPKPGTGFGVRVLNRLVANNYE